MTVYYVCASTGSDTNAGTITSPLLTIQCASNLAQPGDTVLVQPGIYRERVSPPRGGISSTVPIIYKSAVPQGAIIRGSIPWNPTEKLSETVYYDTLDPTIFTDTSAIDGPNPFRIPFCVTPYGRNGAPESASGDKKATPNMVYTLGQVFVNDKMYKQCPFISEMQETPNTWYYDMSSNKLYVNLKEDIDHYKIEITNQRRVFAPHIRQLRYITVDGFVIERCGNNYPNQFWTVAQNQQAGMIGTRSGRFWIIQNNVIRFASGIGIDWGNEGGAAQDLETGTNGKASGSYGNIIQNNHICDNGAGGTAYFMGKNFTFANNVVERNNNLLFYGTRRWESAGLKVHTPTNSVIINNIIRNNYCNGIWSDQGAGQNSIFKNNIIINNKGYGLNFEIGTNTSGKVLNNIFDGNEYNICFATSGGCLIAHNLFLSSTKGDINTVVFNRPDKWDSLNVEIYYNIFTNSKTYLALSTSNAIASRFLNYNQYAVDGRFIFMPNTKTNVPMNISEWSALWKTTNGGENSDETSAIVAAKYTSIELVENQYCLSLTFGEEPSSFPIVERADIVDDYFGKNWANEKGVCIAGPFASIPIGSIKLNIHEYS
jgi:hypothetical protein